MQQKEPQVADSLSSVIFSWYFSIVSGDRITMCHLCLIRLYLSCVACTENWHLCSNCHLYVSGCDQVISTFRVTYVSLKNAHVKYAWLVVESKFTFVIRCHKLWRSIGIILRKLTKPVDLTSDLHIVLGLRMHRTLHACLVYNSKIYVNRRMWDVAAHTITDLWAYLGRLNLLNRLV
jgi:hypothetical protein